MRPSDGGDFPNALQKLLALRQGGSASLDDLKNQDDNQKDALALAQAGTIGSIGKVGAGIKLIPSAADIEAEQFAAKFPVRNFFSKIATGSEQAAPAAESSVPQAIENSAQTTPSAPAGMYNGGIAGQNNQPSLTDALKNRVMQRAAILSKMAGINDTTQTKGDNDSIRQIASPIDFLPLVEGASALGRGASAIAASAPRTIGNEVGAAGPNISDLIKKQQIDELANKMRQQGPILPPGHEVPNIYPPGNELGKGRTPSMRAIDPEDLTDVVQRAKSQNNSQQKDAPNTTVVVTPEKDPEDEQKFSNLTDLFKK